MRAQTPKVQACASCRASWQDGAHATRLFHTHKPNHSQAAQAHVCGQCGHLVCSMSGVLHGPVTQHFKIAHSTHLSTQKWEPQAIKTCTAYALAWCQGSGSPSWRAGGLAPVSTCSRSPQSQEHQRHTRPAAARPSCSRSPPGPLRLAPQNQARCGSRICECARVRALTERLHRGRACTQDVLPRQWAFPWAGAAL